jgi:hypothetical protein
LSENSLSICVAARTDLELNPDFIMKTYKFTVFCTHRQWIRKSDPSGFGKFTYSTDDLLAWKARCEKTGVRIDKIQENTVTDPNPDRRPLDVA